VGSTQFKLIKGIFFSATPERAEIAQNDVMFSHKLIYGLFNDALMTEAVNISETLVNFYMALAQQ
jgi:hypothetical protein